MFVRIKYNVQGDEDFMEDSLDSSQKNNELQALINNYLMSIEFDCDTDFYL